jgi:methylphosphotriester-DNA--protein-cysteine methyltransferase
MFTTTSTRWAALESRNPLAADAFIYCVKSTKIYCRPTCPSRLARRANVIFHNSYIEAAAAGYRPCKRCRPDVQGDDADAQKLAVKKACDLMRMEQSGRKRTVKELGKEVGLTESHFCRIFKKIVGRTVGEHRRYLSTMSASEGEPGRSCSGTPVILVDNSASEEDLIDWTYYQDIEKVGNSAEDIDFSLFDESWWHEQ